MDTHQWSKELLPIWTSCSSNAAAILTTYNEGKIVFSITILISAFYCMFAHLLLISCILADFASTTFFPAYIPTHTAANRSPNSIAYNYYVESNRKSIIQTFTISYKESFCQTFCLAYTKPFC